MSYFTLIHLRSRQLCHLHLVPLYLLPASAAQFESSQRGVKQIKRVSKDQLAYMITMQKGVRKTKI